MMDGDCPVDDDGRGTPTPKESESAMPPPSSPVSRDQLTKRIESLSQQNRVLKCELETYKLRVKSLQEENRCLRQASVHIQAKAEQEEEFISNTLLKKIQALKKEKENLALNYEQEEECLTNDLSRKLDQVTIKCLGPMPLLYICPCKSALTRYHYSISVPVKVS